MDDLNRDLGGEAHLNGISVAMLLFKGNEAAIDILGLCLGDVVQGVPEDGPGPLILLHLLLKLRKLDEQLLLHTHLSVSAHVVSVEPSHAGRPAGVSAKD